MPFSNGSQTENEPDSTGVQIFLVGVKNNGGIQKCCRFGRILVAEIGADEHFSSIGYVQFLPGIVKDLPISAVKCLFNIRVPVLEFLEYFFQLFVGFSIR